MKTKRTPLLVFLATSALWPSLLAQQTAPAAAPRRDDVLELSPFEVSASEDNGYQATTSLAGTRIRTDMRDVASAISVATAQFLADTGATNTQQLLQYMTGAEVGGPMGNFGGLGDTGALDDQAARLNPNSNTRIRGLASADNTRDFFITDIPWDSYNTSRIDVQRGANSILFGNGSGAGILNGDVDSAVIGRNKTIVEVRYGSYGSYRGSLDFNRTLIAKQLAVKFSALYDKDFYRQDPAFNQDKRYYGAFTLEPEFLKKGSARTRLEVNYERGDINANRPRTTPPVDEITPWFITSNREMRSPYSLGRPSGTDDTLLGVIQPMISHAGYDPFVTGINTAAVITANPSRRDIGAGVAGTANSEPWITFGSGNGINGDWQGGFGAIFADPTSGGLQRYLKTGVDGYYALGANGARDGGIGALRTPLWNGLLSFSDYAQTRNFLYQGSGVYRQTTINDPSIFDFYNRLFDGPNKGEFSRFKAYNATLTQTFLDDRIGFQGTYDYQSYRNGQWSNLGGSPILGLDIFSYLPAATPDSNGLLQPIANPNFGRPWTVSGRGNWSNTLTERETLRLTPYADVNFKDIMGRDNWLTKFLGRHQITGLLEDNRVERRSLSGPTNTLSYDQAAAIIGPGGGIGDVNRKIVVVSYLGPSLATASSLVGANISPITGVQRPGAGSALFFNATNYLASAPAPGTPYVPPAIGLSPSQTGGAATTASENPANYTGWTGNSSITVNNVDATGNYIATQSSLTKDVTKSWALVDQWALFNRSIIVMGGIRKDEIKTYLPNGTGNAPNGAATYNTVDGSQPLVFPSTPTREFTSETLKTWSIVAHSPEWINRRLPWGLKGSAYFGRSENFQPRNLIDVYGNKLPPPSGTTKEYGILIEALDGRLALKVNKFETVFKGAVLVDSGNGLRSRIGDELEQGLRFALQTKYHVPAPGYRQNNPFDPTGLYAWTPTRYAKADGSIDLTDAGVITASSLLTRPVSQADWQATETYAQAVAQSYLDKTVNETAILSAFGINPATFDTATGTFPGRNTPAGLEITSDTLSKGTEFELSFKPTRNWDIIANAAKVFATRTNLAGSTVDWMTRRRALYDDATWLGSQLPWFGASQANTDQAGRNNTNGFARFGRNAWAFYNLFRAQEGNATPEMREWRFNITNRYSFTEGRLKGVFVGGSYRYEGKQIIGYGLTEVTPAFGANAAIGVLDPNKPFYGPKEDAIDLFAGYNRKIWHDINWRIQVNVRDTFGKAHLIPVNTNPDGSIASYRIDSGRTWEISSRFEF